MNTLMLLVKRCKTLSDSDSDKNSIISVVRETRANYAAQLRKARADLDELDVIVNRAKDAITKIEIATSLTQVSSLLEEFDQLNMSIDKVKKNIVSFTEETEDIARRSMGL